MTAMIVMAVSIGICWYYLPAIFQHRYRIFTIRYCGILAMLVSIFLPFGPHDTVINISAFFTVIALLSSFAGFYYNRYYKLLALGLLCFAFATTNKLVYEFVPGRTFLPIIQEATFLCFLVWFALVSWKIYATLSEKSKVKSKILNAALVTLHSELIRYISIFYL